MDLITESDIYSPNIDANGKYIDKIPSFHIYKNGLRCPCGSRKDKIYDCSSYFNSHIKTKTHQKWLENINANKTNYYIENIKLLDTINNQKLIIAKMEKDINTKILTIDFLTQQLSTYKNIQLNQVNNLLDFD
jgi:inner membrane protein involved in colicin E2 resistance